MATRIASTTGTGFTLLEVMVVLLIMGLLVGLVSALVLPDDQARLDVETQRLAQLLALASEQSRMGGHDIAWTVLPAGYGFLQREAGSFWTPVAGSDLLRARELPSGMAIVDLRVENTPATGPQRLEFNADGAALAFTLGLRLGTARSAIAGSPIGDIAVVDSAGVGNALALAP
ncbi:MAG: type II secretion system protein GspH [Lysobacteraceae bacterium]|nr:MAG: type II secretion system protein GspH [Xanthomonadaceae bacterium]